MTFSSEWRGNFAEYDHEVLSGSSRPRQFGGAALVCIAFACAWTLWSNLAGGGAEQSLEAQSAAAKVYARLTVPAGAYAKLKAALTSHARRPALSNAFIALFDPRPLGFRPATFARNAALEADGAPAPSASDGSAPPAQQLAGPHSRTASLDGARAGRAAANVPADRPTIFEKLFGKRSPPALAYAAAEDDGAGLGRGVSSGRYDRRTAVYDISAHTVYLPDGTILEAHSGFGPRLDNPRYADEKMRGATPPNVYDLEPREGLFHGVQALRLIPVDEAKVFGRTGLLAHTFMLGPNGQSNGCVSFRRYDAFLRAYTNGEIKRLAVVSRLD
jgi:hypothetical protein